MTPEQLWEKYAVLMYPPKSEIPEYVISTPNFHAALTEYGEAVRADALAVLVEAVQKEHGGDITNPKCPICIAINAVNEKPIDPNKWAFDRGLESY